MVDAVLFLSTQSSTFGPDAGREACLWSTRYCFCRHRVESECRSSKRGPVFQHKTTNCCNLKSWSDSRCLRCLSPPFDEERSNVAKDFAEQKANAFRERKWQEDNNDIWRLDRVQHPRLKARQDRRSQRRSITPVEATKRTPMCAETASSLPRPFRLLSTHLPPLGTCLWTRRMLLALTNEEILTCRLQSQITCHVQTKDMLAMMWIERDEDASRDKNISPRF